MKTISFFFSFFYFYLILINNAYSYIGLGPLIPIVGNFLLLIFGLVISIFGMIIGYYKIFKSKNKKSSNFENKNKYEK